MNFHDVFADLGGQLNLPEAVFRQKLSKIRALIFDWDGVFNDGEKDLSRGSTFSEVDSMGVNLLRFSQWLDKGRLPICAVMSGAKNLIAADWCKRERFHALATGAVDKTEAYDRFLKEFGLEDDEVLFVFDDVLDLGIAQRVAIPIAVRRTATPLLNAYIDSQLQVAYITGNPGGHHAVRETCELLIGMADNMGSTISKRADFDEDYREYLSQRQAVELKVLSEAR